MSFPRSTSPRSRGIYARFRRDDTSKVAVDGKTQVRVCSKIFDNREFGYLKLTVERPLRLNFQASPERIKRLHDESAFLNLAKSKKRKDTKAHAAEVAEGAKLQAQVIAVLEGLDATILYSDRDAFVDVLNEALTHAGAKVKAPVSKAILSALSERDSTAEICRDANGNPEPDAKLRDTEIVPLPSDVSLPLPIGYEKDADNAALVALVKPYCDNRVSTDLLTHFPDAWIDYTKSRVGYEIPLTRHFYIYEPPRPLDEIVQDIEALEVDFFSMLREVVT